MTRCPSCDFDLDAHRAAQSKEWVRQYQSGLSTSQIGDKYGIAHGVVLYAIKKLGVEVRAASDKVYWTEERKQKARTGGMKGAAMRRKHGITGYTRGCRCEICKGEKRDADKRYNSKQLKAGNPSIPNP